MCVNCDSSLSPLYQINYDAFRIVASHMPKKVQPFFKPSVFLKFPHDRYGRISARAFLHYVVRIGVDFVETLYTSLLFGPVLLLILVLLFLLLILLFYDIITLAMIIITGLIISVLSVFITCIGMYY